MSWTKGLKLRMACNKLRIDPNDGSPVVEYRIENGRVARRTVAACTGDGVASEERWEQLTPTQVASDIMANSTVAYWLYCRLDAQSIFQVCSQHPDFVTDKGVEFPHKNRQVVVGEFSPLESIPAR